MKKLFFLTLICFAAYFAKAQRFTSSSEFFLEIIDRGSYTVYVDGESITSSKCRFRFYDVLPGQALLSIQSNGKQVYKDYIRLEQGIRTIASFERNSRVQMISDKQIYRNGQYALDDWDGEMNESRSENVRPGRYYAQPMSPESFGKLINLARRESFDTGKHNIIKAALRNNCISVGQLAELLKLFSFDDNRLETAIAAYPCVTNPANYYLIRNAFTFQSSKDKFDKFLLGV